jgi:hypothetical protein
MRHFRALFDLIIVVLFVGIGRSAHDHAINVVGVASTAWPFFTGLVAGWYLVIRGHRSGSGVTDGVIVCVTTVTVGMVLRVLAGQGTAVAFILVALGFLGALMLGWRFALRSLQRLGKSKSS